MNLKTTLVPALLALVFGLSACGGGDGSDSDSATVTESAESASGDGGQGADAPVLSGAAPRAAKVEIADFAYDPDPVTVQVGGKVIWLNRDSAPHTATAEDGSFDTGTLEEGKLKSETFKQVGTYDYICQIHPDMHGVVEVLEKD
jgi:plastocyanin